MTGTGAASASGYVKVITVLRQKRERDLAAQALQEFGDVLYSHSNVKVEDLTSIIFLSFSFLLFFYDDLVFSIHY